MWRCRTLAYMAAAVVLSLAGWGTSGGALYAGEGYIRFLPSDIKVVLTVQVANIGEADRKKGERLLLEMFTTHLAPELGKEARLPISDMKQAVVGLPYVGTMHSVIMLRGKVDRKAFESQMDRAVAKAKGDALTVEKQGTPAVKVYSRPLDEKKLLRLAPELEKIPPAFRKLVVPQEVFVAAVDDETIFVSLAGKTPMIRALRARPADSTPRVSEQLAGLLNKPEAKDVATLTVMEDPLHPGLILIAEDDVRDSFEQFDHVRVHVRGAKTIEVATRLLAKSKEVGATLEKRSKQMLKRVRGELEKVLPDKEKRGIVEKLLDSVRVTRTDALLALVGTLSAEDGRALLARPEEKEKE